MQNKANLAAKKIIKNPNVKLEVAKIYSQKSLYKEKCGISRYK